MKTYKIKEYKWTALYPRKIVRPYTTAFGQNLKSVVEITKGNPIVWRIIYE